MDSQIVYKWSVPIYPVDAQTAGVELENIAQKHGALKPAYIVEESRETDAVLHDCFEWDDEAAAEKYRCRQAQDMVRNIVTVKVGQIEPPTPIRAFISFRQDHEYVPVSQVLHSTALKENMLAAAMKVLTAFQRKYSALDSLSGLMSTIDKSIQEYNIRCSDSNTLSHQL